MKKTMFFLFLFVALNSCNVNHNIIGTYRSNFANHGFFVTEIEAKKDSTLNYESGGDMMYEKLTGRFKVHRNKLYIIFDKLKDTTKYNPFDTLTPEPSPDYFENLHNYDLQKENDISYHLKYKIKDDKLFAYTNKGKIIRNGIHRGHKQKLFLVKIK